MVVPGKHFSELWISIIRVLLLQAILGARLALILNLGYSVLQTAIFYIWSNEILALFTKGNTPSIPSVLRHVDASCPF